MKRLFSRKIDWKAAGRITVEAIKSLGRGDFLLKLKIHRFLPHILWLVTLGTISILLSYYAEKTMHRVEVNNGIIESLKYDNANKNCEIIGLSRISTIEKMLENAGSEVRIPEAPAHTIKK